MLVVLRNFKLLIVEMLCAEMYELHITGSELLRLLTLTASKFINESTEVLAARLSALFASRRNCVLQDVVRMVNNAYAASVPAVIAAKSQPNLYVKMPHTMDISNAVGTILNRIA